MRIISSGSGDNRREDSRIACGNSRVLTGDYSWGDSLIRRINYDAFEHVWLHIEPRGSPWLPVAEARRDVGPERDGEGERGSKKPRCQWWWTTGKMTVSAVSDCFAFLTACLVCSEMLARLHKLTAYTPIPAKGSRSDLLPTKPAPETLARAHTLEVPTWDNRPWPLSTAFILSFASGSATLQECICQLRARLPASESPV